MPIVLELLLVLVLVDDSSLKVRVQKSTYDTSILETPCRILYRPVLNSSSGSESESESDDVVDPSGILPSTDYVSKPMPSLLPPRRRVLMFWSWFYIENSNFDSPDKILLRNWYAARLDYSEAIPRDSFKLRISWYDKMYRGPLCFILFCSKLCSKQAWYRWNEEKFTNLLQFTKASEKLWNPLLTTVWPSPSSSSVIVTSVVFALDGKNFY